METAPCCLNFSFPPLPPLPPLPLIPAAGDNSKSLFQPSLSDFVRPIWMVLVVILVVILCIGMAGYRFVRRKLRNINASPPPAPHMASADLLEADAETMEKLFQEITKEKPVKFTAQQLNTFTSNYSTQLDYGGFGQVYEGVFPNGVNIAVKLLHINLLDKRVEEQFMAEVRSICRIYHQNLVRLYGFCNEDSISALVLEYMANGSLDKFLSGRGQDIGWGILHDIAIGTARGLAYLHEEYRPSIIHYDIRPANIFLDANFCPKVGNFGDAKLYNRDNTDISSHRGTPGYSAPEFILTNYPITHKCDVYSFGMVLFEMIGRKSNAKTTVFGSPYWFPQCVWEAYEEGKLAELVAGCGVGSEDDREKASRACKVALWCIEDTSDERPPMSAVVKMLEGGVEVMPPPMPFQHSNPIRIKIDTTSLQQSSSTSSDLSTSIETHSRWYREITPIMRENEIQSSSS